MNNTFVIDILTEYFTTEISNNIEKKNNELIVKLGNGMSAKVKTVVIS